ncbi:MAG: hypothetical protein ACRDZY_10680 [Acidimicrobiales bacterium]
MDWIVVAPWAAFGLGLGWLVVRLRGTRANPTNPRRPRSKGTRLRPARDEGEGRAQAWPRPGGEPVGSEASDW